MVALFLLVFPSFVVVAVCVAYKCAAYKSEGKGVPPLEAELKIDPTFLWPETVPLCVACFRSVSHRFLWFAVCCAGRTSRSPLRAAIFRR